MYKTKVNPMFSDLKPLASIFDELINDGLSSVLGAGLVTHSPSVNIVENAEAFIIELAAPGRSKGDFEMKLNQKTLTISLASMAEEKDENKKFIRREYRLLAFEKSFDLPESVDRNAISATYENGVLFVKLPKLNQEESDISRNIEIK